VKLAIFGADHSENTVTIVKAMLTQHVLGYVLGTFRSRFGGVPKHRWLLGFLPRDATIYQGLADIHQIGFLLALGSPGRPHKGIQIP